MNMLFDFKSLTPMILFLLDARPSENDVFEIVTHTSRPSTKQAAKLKSLLSCPR